MAILLLGMLMGSCSDNPTLAEWENAWHQTSAAVPPLATMLADDPGETCSTTVGMLRSAEADMVAAPNPDLAQALLAWSDYAEAVFFECPPKGGAYPGFEASYEEMARLASEVDALLAFEHGVQTSG